MVFLAFITRLPLRATVKRIIILNVFMLALFVLLPLSTPGNPVFTVGAFFWSAQGLRLATNIALKANTIVLLFTALLSTVEPVRLGHALHSLGVPEKLVHLLLFTVRYIDVIHHEYDRLRNAMKVRCFKPGMNLHTFRTYGNLVGMLLVNSFDRSDRIIAAMKCRGYQGRFHVLENLVAGRRDALFAVIALLLMLTLGWLEWVWIPM